MYARCAMELKMKSVHVRLGLSLPLKQETRAPVNTAQRRIKKMQAG
jgi:hypothetical protein